MEVSFLRDCRVALSWFRCKAWNQVAKLVAMPLLSPRFLKTDIFLPTGGRPWFNNRLKPPRLIRARLGADAAD